MDRTRWFLLAAWLFGLVALLYFGVVFQSVDYRNGRYHEIPRLRYAATSALAAAIAMYFRHRYRHCLRAPAGDGVCLHCGYDLRATPGRCPECGCEPGAVPANEDVDWLDAAEKRAEEADRRRRG